MESALAAAPVATGLGILGTFGWINRKKEERMEAANALAEEQQRRASLLVDSFQLRAADEAWTQVEGVGQVPMMVAGTAAANQLPLILESYQRAGATSFLGPILLAEPDEASRAACYQAIPPEFHNRVIGVGLPLIPGGLLGRTPQEVEDLKDYYEYDLDDAVRRWLALMRIDSKPVHLLALVSPGGSGALGWSPIVAFKSEYPQLDVYVSMVLDEKTRRRESNTPPLLDLFGQGCCVKGFLIGDNRRNPELFDQGLALALPSMVAATWIDPRPQAGFNVFADLFRHHRVATMAPWAGWLPMRHLPAWRDALPEVFFTRASFTASRAIYGINQVMTNPALQSLPLRRAARPSFVYIAAPIRPDPDLRALDARIQSSLGGRFGYDTTISFASIGHPLTPRTYEIPMVAAAVFPVQGGLEAVKRLAMGRAVSEAFTPSADSCCLEPAATSRNGRGVKIHG